MLEEKETYKQQLAKFGRAFALVFNRSFMYSTNHPFQIESINTAYKSLKQLLQNVSPTVFIMNGDKFCIDEEPLDPRVNVTKILTHFKKTKMESISFYRGIEIKELQLLLEIVTSLSNYPNADAMSKALFKKRINHIKINHIFYKKVSAEDEVISRDFLDKVTPDMIVENQDEMKKMFMDSVFNSVLQEEFVNKLNLENLLMNPNNLSQEMLAADLSTVNQYENNYPNENNNELLRPGQFLLHQLEVIDQDVEKNLSEGKKADLSKIADALFDMQQKLIEGLEAQKALGIAYSNEEEVLSKTNEIRDKVLTRLIKEEYKGGETGIVRLAQILCRLIPEASELKRLLPKIKSALIEEGMSQADFMDLITELSTELQNDGLVKILSESAEEIGIDGNDIIEQVKENPVQSAEMIYLASEIKKRGGDEKALTDLIVNYVEQIGSKCSKDLTGKNGKEGETHIKRTFAEVKSNLTKQFGSIEIEEDLLNQLEVRVNERMDEIFNKLRVDWINSHSVSPIEKFQELTVLETLERGVNEEDELGHILKIIRRKVETGEIDENDFDQIYQEMVKQERLIKSEDDVQRLPSGIMREKMLITFIDKEIAKARRYKMSLSALAFTLVKVKAKTSSQPKKINTRDITDALLYKFLEIFRTPDIIGEVRKNQFIILLPMTHQGKANLTLRRAMKILHLNPLNVGGIAFELKVAGVATEISWEGTEDAEKLIDQLASQLKDMATRIGNLHAYS